MNLNINDNNSTKIKVNEIPKKINGELSTLKHITDEEKENEVISQSEEMIKKQRQITNFNNNNEEEIKTNNNVIKSYFYHKLGKLFCIFWKY